MKNLILAGLSAVALGAGITAAATPALADIVSVTITGTVSSGADTDGLFGAAGADLTGYNYVAQYAFDTSYGISINSAAGSVLGGGPGYGYTTPPGSISPSLGASLTINGQTASIIGAYGAAVYEEISGMTALYNAIAADSSSVGLQNYIYGDPNDPLSIDSNLTITSSGNSGDVGEFVDGGTSLNLTTSVYTQTVPEPASMALLSIGLLGTGVLARRRKQHGTQAAG